MAMPSGNVVLSDTMQFPGGAHGVGGGGEGGGGDIHHHHRQWFPDERDGFISWLRGEFAAANSIIDLLCNHLRSIGEPGEYDFVIGCIQQRRCNWNPVLHMQQYFSVAEVTYSLQQVAWRRQQRYFEQGRTGGKEYRKFGVGSRQGQRGEIMKEVHNSNVEGHIFYGNSSLGNVPSEKGERGSEKSEEVKTPNDFGNSDDKCLAVAEEKKGAGADGGAKSHSHRTLNSSVNSEVTMSANSELEDKALDDGSTSNSGENNSGSIRDHNEKQICTIIPKSFIGNEIFDGKTVNVVDGLKLYDDLFDDTEVSKLVSLVNDLRTSGKRGQFQGQTYVVSKRPMKGRGREMIQLGLPIADTPPEDENPAAISKDRRIESIPGLLQDVIKRLVGMEIITVKADSCIIDFYNEGDHSQPHMWPPWFGRPISILFLTECDMTFGRVIGVDHPGDYRGSLKLSLASGSLIVMQGKSADFAKYAIPSTGKPRILVAFTKSQTKKFVPSDGHRLSSPALAPVSHWGQPPNRSLNHIRHPIGPKHYAAVPATGVLPAPPIRAQIPPPNGIQPLFVTTPVAAALPFPAPVPIQTGSTGWPAAPPRHPAPHLPVPGTGVFLPPGSGNSSSQHQSTTATETNITAEMVSIPEKEIGSGKSNRKASPSPKGKLDLDGKVERHECNGSVVKEEQQQSSDNTVASKPDGAV